MRAVLLCAAPNINSKFVKEQIRCGDFLVCVDGGYYLAEKLGLFPNLVVGDFDSYKTPSQIKAKEIITLPANKDDTDTFYAIKETLKHDVDEILILGGTGGRLDHTFANFSLLKHVYNRCNCKIEDEENIIFYTEEEYTIHNQENRTVSIFPFACQAAQISLHGFSYPLNNYNLQADVPLGISNVIEKKEAKIEVKGGGVLIFMLK